MRFKWSNFSKSSGTCAVISITLCQAGFGWDCQGIVHHSSEDRKVDFRRRIAARIMAARTPWNAAHATPERKPPGPRRCTSSMSPSLCVKKPKRVWLGLSKIWRQSAWSFKIQVCAGCRPHIAQVSCMSSPFRQKTPRTYFAHPQSQHVAPLVPDSTFSNLVKAIESQKLRDR